MSMKQNWLLFLACTSIFTFTQAYEIISKPKTTGNLFQANENLNVTSNYTGAISSNGIGCAEIGKYVTKVRKKVCGYD